jgi:hypothetical protein
LNRLLAASCWLTSAATVYLTVAAIILRPPRLNGVTWAFTAAFLLAQSALTLILASGPNRRDWVHSIVGGGAVLIASLGAWWVRQTTSGAHFEGFALILGSLALIQGLFTVAFLFEKPIGSIDPTIASRER